ncbi:MAG: ABC-type transport auxiliary lipoprotein family protein [Burkholderiaceae bacterium]
MSSPTTRARSFRQRLLLPLIAAAFCAGCFSVGLGGEGSPQAQYRVEDLSPQVPSRATPIDRRLLVSTAPSETIGDTFSMAYTRAPQQRQFYQYASWTDRPSARIVQLLTERIRNRAMFESVSNLGGGIGGGLLLNVGVNEFIHDVRAGTARIEVTAELIERGGRTSVGRKRFTASAPVAEESAPSAVAALNRALTTLLDELVPWLERTAESLPPPEPRPREGKG